MPSGRFCSVRRSHRGDGRPADGELRVVTSTITSVEVLTQPLRQRAVELVTRYRELLPATEGLTV
jgi:hypothetical protein